MNRYSKLFKIISILILGLGIFAFSACKENAEEELLCYVEMGVVSYSDYITIFNAISSPDTLTNEEVLKVKSELQKKTFVPIERLYDCTEQDLWDFANGRMTHEQADKIIGRLKKNINSITFFEVLGNENMCAWIYVAKSY